ncbi:MAG TPA: VWA domain-containing protein [Candidatus Hydrogenedentes bacterium]|nr:VWA domain-containing protein [Candidatus Hydrogenedentota bacterium]HPU97439.1 VWA domain-containing protein [Candidatus Hydrogenedentota bacterium]
MNGTVSFTFPLNSALAGLVILFFAILGVQLFWWVAERRRRARLRRFAAEPLLSTLYPPVLEQLRKPLPYILTAGIVMAILALYQPRWGSGWEKRLRASRDILIVLDVSESMNAASPPPSRLARAKQKIELLMDRCPGDRFGLVVFSGEAALLSPLTLDKNYVRSVLRAVDTDLLNAEGTNFNAAFEEVVRVFEEDARKTGTSERYARVVILLSDAEQTREAGESSVRALREWASVFLLGIGSPDGSVVRYPQWMNRYVPLPPEKQTHVSVLDEDAMRRMADMLGGSYVRMTDDDQDIRLITDGLEEFRSRSQEDAIRQSRINRYRWPLFGAFLLFLLEGIWLQCIPRVTRYYVRRASS